MSVYFFYLVFFLFCHFLSCWPGLVLLYNVDLLNAWLVSVCACLVLETSEYYTTFIYTFFAFYVCSSISYLQILNSNDNDLFLCFSVCVCVSVIFFLLQLFEFAGLLSSAREFYEINGIRGYNCFIFQVMEFNTGTVTWWCDGVGVCSITENEPINYEKQHRWDWLLEHVLTVENTGRKKNNWYTHRLRSFSTAGIAYLQGSHCLNRLF